MSAEPGDRDGAAVQADLRAVIERAKDARAVLGLAPHAGPGEARTAFHALCKKYHPARFARSSPETIRLANEAFLAIKRAYDGLVRPPDAAPKPISDAPSGRMTVAIPVVPRTTTPIARPTDRPTEKVPAPARVTAPIPRPSAADRSTDRLPAQPHTQPVPRPTMPITPIPRATVKTPAIDPAATEEQRFAAALDLLRRRLWKDADKLFGELAVSVPTDRRYRAYRHYARGRMAQDEGRLDEARGEWERALRLEPELTAAKAAIDSLPEPPKPTGGGLLSKLFKR